MSEYNGILYSAAPPEGVIPDYSLPYQASSLVVCTALFFPLAFLFTLARIWTRARILGELALDDYLMIAATVCSAVLTGTIFHLLNWGLGKHLYNVPLNVIYGDGHFAEVNLIAAIFFCAATGFAKTSILLFYLRIFPSRIFGIVIYSFTALAAGYSVASVFVNIFSCTPVRASWDIAYAAVEGICINRPVFYLAQASLGILVDFLTLIAPLPLMWKLQLPTRQKIIVLAILGMGGFVCIISIIRLQSLRVLLVSTDLTADTPNALMWCVLELNLSIIGGCSPTIKPLLRKYFPFILGRSSIDGTSYGTSNRKHRIGTDPMNTRSGFRLESISGNDGDSEVPSALRQGTKGYTSTKIGVSHDLKGNSSEEFIFQPQYANDNKQAITRKVEFGMTFEDDDHNEPHGR